MSKLVKVQGLMIKKSHFMPKLFLSIIFFLVIELNSLMNIVHIDCALFNENFRSKITWLYIILWICWFTLVFSDKFTVLSDLLFNSFQFLQIICFFCFCFKFCDFFIFISENMYFFLSLSLFVFVNMNDFHHHHQSYI